MQAVGLETSTSLCFVEYLLLLRLSFLPIPIADHTPSPFLGGLRLYRPTEGFSCHAPILDVCSYFAHDRHTHSSRVLILYLKDSISHFEDRITPPTCRPCWHLQKRYRRHLGNNDTDKACYVVVLPLDGKYKAPLPSASLTTFDYILSVLHSLRFFFK